MLETLPTVNKPIWTTPCLWKKIEWQQYYLGERIYGLPFDSVSQGSKHKSGFPKRTSNTMCMHASAYVYMYICIYTHMYIYIYIYIYMCTYVRMYVCMYDIYIYMQALNLSLATAFFSYYFVFLCCFFRYFVLVSCLSFLFSLCVVIWLMRSLSFFLSVLFCLCVFLSVFLCLCVLSFFRSAQVHHDRTTTTKQKQTTNTEQTRPPN